MRGGVFGNCAGLPIHARAFRPVVSIKFLATEGVIGRHSTGMEPSEPHRVPKCELTRIQHRDAGCLKQHRNASMMTVDKVAALQLEPPLETNEFADDPDGVG